MRRVVRACARERRRGVYAAPRKAVARGGMGVAGAAGGDVRVVASCVGLLRNMGGRDAAMRAVCGEMWWVTRVVGGGGRADG